MNEEQLYDILRKYQEPLGYFFNKDKERVFDLLKGLLINKKRYGYMSCPCRLATGDREKDKDIICPCVYREPDVEEYGAVIAISMFQRHGTTGPFHINMSPREDH